jgi:outer membrane immunogenic protein
MASLGRKDAGAYINDTFVIGVCNMKYRSVLLAATVLSLAASSAFAADLPRKAYRPVTPAPVMTWTGFYAGLNAGYGWADVSIDNGPGSDLDGFVGGGQIGYNWQTGPLVIGLEGDFQGSGQSDSASGVVAGLGTVTVDQDIRWLGTLRGRLGYASGPWLLYVTGGGAWLNYKLTVSAGGASVDDDTSKGGWTIGGGVEWMFVPKWSAKLEYLYVDTGDTNVTLGGVNFDGRAKDNLVRVGINYHF